MSTHSFENKKSVLLRVLSSRFVVGKMKTAIVVDLEVYSDILIAKLSRNQ